MRKVLKWIDEQTEIVSMLHHFMREPLPKTTGYPHVFGSLALILFVIQVLTGGFLLVYYSPSPENAYATVQYITTKLIFGNVVRGLHHWAATGMMVALGLHMLQVFFWGAYKKPRQIIWVFGVFLLLLTFGFAFTGYLLPWDQKAYWATVVGTNIAGSVPGIGIAIRDLLRGGETVGALTLTRFFSLHIYFLPPVMCGLVVFHIFQVRKKGITPSWTKVGEESTSGAAKATQFFWPHQVFRDLVVGIVVLAVLLLVAVNVGAPIEPMANPADTAYVPRPEWYYLWLFEALKYFPGKLEFVGGVLLPSLGIIGLLLLPYLDKNPERRPRRRPFVTLACLITFFGMTILGVNAIVTTPHEKPLSPIAKQGEKIFLDRRCETCHGINGGGGNAGPDLAQANLKDKEKLLALLKEPEKFHPRSVMPPTNLASGDLEALATFLQEIGPMSRMPEQPSVGPKKPQSHFEEAWFLNHKYEVRKDPAQCSECHKQEFCQSCHLKRRPDSHLKNWLKFHFGTAREKPAYCAVCHKEEFCTNCHNTYSHTPDWLPAKHKVAAKANGNQFCFNCHKQDFCSGCHNGAKPATHVQGWVQMHGKQVGTNSAACATCHDTKTFCKDCHQGAKPKSHVVGWVQMHGKQVGSNTAACNACHETKTFCSSCHEGAKPKNHTVKWIDLHGKTAIASNANCAKCHTSKMCIDCHQTPIPHAKDWADTHKNFATLGKGSFCYRCHDQKQFCGQCHGN